MKELAFIETTEEIQSIEKYCQQRGKDIGDIVIVALNLKTQIYMERKGISCCTTLPFFGNQSHRQCLSHTIYIYKEILQNSSCSISGKSYLGVVDWFGVWVGYAGVGYVTYLVEVMSNAVKAIKPSRLLIEKEKTNGVRDATDLQTLFHRPVAQVIAETNSIEYEFFNEEGVGADETSTLEISFSQDALSTNEENAEDDPKSLSGKEMVENKGDRPILVYPSMGYNLKWVVRQIKKWYPEIPIVVCHDKGSSLFDRLKNYSYGARTLTLKQFERADLGSSQIDLNIEQALSMLPNILKYRDVEYWNIVKGEINRRIVPSTHELAHQSLKLIGLLEVIKPRLVISAMSMGLSYVLGEACRYQGLKGLCIPHGTVSHQVLSSSAEYNKMIAKAVMLNHYPTVAAQTPIAEKFLNTSETSSQIINTGPLVFKKIRKRNKIGNKIGNKIVILHAVTLKESYSIKFWGVETLDEFVSSTKDIIDVVKDRKNFILHIKLHPVASRILSVREWKRCLNLPSNAYIRNTSITSELANSDILISYSSTVIEEALINNVPVILYDKWERYKHLDAVHLTCTKEITLTPVYYVTDSNVLNDAIPLIVKLKREKQLTGWDRYVYRNNYINNFKELIH